jgi:hypothetical protein
MKTAPLIVLAATLAGLAGCSSSRAASAAIPELTKADATKLLGFMGYETVVVAAVINGVGTHQIVSFSSPNVALVFAYTERAGKPTDADAVRTFFYDRELGWFYHEIDPGGHRVRLWTISGYKELKPAPPPPAK